MKSHKSAIVIIPPESVWDQIQNIRRKYDKAYLRWMPHINLIYPFKPDTEFQSVVPQLEEKFSSVKAFDVSMTSDAFGYFEHGQSCGMWLKPLLTKHKTDNREETHRKNDILSPQMQPTLKKTVQNRKVETRKTMEISNHVCNLTHSIYLNNIGSLSSLKNAVWKTGENDRNTSLSNQAGLESLRDAVWTPGDTDFTFETFNDSLSIPEIPENSCEQNIISSQLMIDEEFFEEQQPSTDQDGILPSDNNVNLEMLTDDLSGFTEVIRKKKVVSTKHHLAVLNLQQNLENLFPEYNDLSVINKCGFQPHLTLGQFKKDEIQEVLAEFKKKWTPIHFRVSEIYLISRLGFNDKFEIRQTIALNG